MKHLAALLCLPVLAAGCGSNGGGLLTIPSAPSATSPSISPAREITVGEEVTGTLEAHGAENVFELTARSDGTLVVRLSWAPTQGRLELWLADSLSSQSDRPPVVGKLPVAAGRKYRVKVADSAAWDYDSLFLPYALTTAIE